MLIVPIRLYSITLDIFLLYIIIILIGVHFTLWATLPTFRSFIAFRKSFKSSNGTAHRLK